MMIIETRFDLGEKVFAIAYTRKVIRERCPVCGGAGDYETPIGVKVKCAECLNAPLHGHPRGTVAKTLPLSWYVAGVFTIGQVRAYRHDLAGGDPNHIADNYKPKTHADDKEEYMMWETGIGSGTLYPSDKLFRTRKEAEAECDKCNSEGGGIRKRP